MILVIDNYDSFTYNLVQYLGELGVKQRVYRNDVVTISEIRKLRPERILISPGPGVPADAGLSIEIVRSFAAEIPILGVCLGHQAIGEAFGGRVIRAPYLMHGKVSEICHDSATIFRGIPYRFKATRYHSLIVDHQTLPPLLTVTATTDGQIPMGVRHATQPTEGVQFHPESILTTHGQTIIRNFAQSIRRRTLGASDDAPLRPARAG